MELDLDKARAARLEAKGEGHTVIFGGVEFTMPSEMPYAAAEAIERGNFRVALADMLNGTSEKFFELRPSTDDIEALVTGMVEMYTGSSMGESSASSPSSKRTTKTSRRPSSANTPSR